MALDRQSSTADLNGTATALGAPAYDAACAALRQVAQDPGASTFALHSALARLARVAREERIAPRTVLACLHGLIAKSPLAIAHASADGRWYSTARRLVATEYYG